MVADAAAISAVISATNSRNRIGLEKITAVLICADIKPASLFVRTLYEEM